MKKLAFITIGLLMGGFAFAQAGKVEKHASMGDKVPDHAITTAGALSKGKAAGTFSMKVPESITSAEVAEKNAYYTKYFTANLNEATHELSFTMTENNADNRHVMNRMLTGLGVNHVDVDGKPYELESFYQVFTK